MNVNPLSQSRDIGRGTFNKTSVYEMTWPFSDDRSEFKGQLQQFLIAGCPYGGPIAMMRDRLKITREDIGCDSLLMFSSSGKLLARFPEPQNVCTFGWSVDEKLVVIRHNGHIGIYNIFGRLTDEFEVHEEVLDAIIYPTGAVILGASRALYALEDLEKPKCISQLMEADEAQLTVDPTCMAVIEPKFTRHGVEVLLAVEGEIISISRGMMPQRIDCRALGPIQAMEVSPNGAYVAVYSRNGVLRVLPVEELQGRVDATCELSTESRRMPKQMTWCSSNAVILNFVTTDPDDDEEEDMLICVTLDADHDEFRFDEAVWVMPEYDGVRIFSGSACEFLHPVASCVEDIFGFQNTSIPPGRVLKDAYVKYKTRQHDTEEYIRNVQPKLGQAVATCVNAAGHVFDTEVQKLLLHAASFGKMFCEEDGDEAATYDAEPFVRMCRTLRILNAVRDADIGMPLTHCQYDLLTPARLVGRLMHRHHHLLAIRISKSLDMSIEPVLVHWGCVKVRQTESTEEIVRQIREKFRQCPGISYAEVAKAVNRTNRGNKDELVIKLLEHEPSPAKQVALLLEMDQSDEALRKATQSGDMHLVHRCLLELKPTLGEEWDPEDHRLQEFLRMVRAHPVALDLFLSYCRKADDVDILQAYYHGSGQPHEAALVALRHAFKNSDLRDRLHDFSRHTPFLEQGSWRNLPRHMEDYGKLLQKQREITYRLVDTGAHRPSQPKSDEYPTSAAFGAAIAEFHARGQLGPNGLLDLSLADTLTSLIAHGAYQEANQLVKTSKLPDKRYWWIKLRALAHAGQWEMIEQMGSKKSPIGFEPFVEVCMQHNNNTEARKYVTKISNALNKFEFLIQLGMFDEAHAAVSQIRDKEELHSVHSRLTDPNAREVVENILESLQR
eukprot:gnl/Trimastix_PCT/3712.p1 GENE.gnl/Trimastix_PCT/3712~~gnl/Trimastix_PCT/3712.p1  ORF type:complete len:895 (-),score=303.24 gnl/Trimastix_PCT/3712:119-2803(-)